jgi:hypothetical protein
MEDFRPMQLADGKFVSAWEQSKLRNECTTYRVLSGVMKRGREVEDD